MHATRTKTGSGYLTDIVRETPVDRQEIRLRRITMLVLFLILLALVLWVLWHFNSDVTPRYANIEEHFKYGSIGAEPGGSLMDAHGGLLPPYEIFRILPKVAPEKLPGGYQSLGMVFEPGKDMPIGISRRFRLGFDQVGINCAFCHVGTYRSAPDAQRTIVLGMPANRLEIQKLFRFVLDATLDQRFTPDNVIGLIEQNGGEMSWLDALLYRMQMVYRVREATLQMQDRMGILFDKEVTPWGPGRVDTFNPYKATQFNWPLRALPTEELIGASDYPSLWNQKPREGMNLHWDGNNSSVDERNRSAALGAGVTPVTLDRKNLERVRDWIWTMKPPVYPFPINESRVAQGRALYARYCLDCHGNEQFRDGVATGSQLGKVTPIENVGTDPHRLNSYTWTFAANQYTLYPNPKEHFRHFRKTNGYANHPLDGIWIRGPYLHNGAVPTLRDLLEAPENRPKQFYKGYDVFDQQRVGFVYNVASEGATQHMLFDTALPGNGNGGHLYGTQLTPQEKDAIVEYMKRF